MNKHFFLLLKNGKKIALLARHKRGMNLLRTQATTCPPLVPCKGKAFKSDHSFTKGKTGGKKERKK